MLHIPLPYADPIDNAKCFTDVHLYSFVSSVWQAVCSLAAVYRTNPVNGRSGWSGIPQTEFWRGHEMQLVRYGLAAAEEWYVRPIKKANQRSTRRGYRDRFRGLYEVAEREKLGDSPPSLIGDDDFHSAFRALLKFLECRALTFKNWKNGVYPASMVHALPGNKASWRSTDYESIWSVFGYPELVWYSQFGWTEEPNGSLIFYEEDKIPYHTKYAHIKNKALRTSSNEEEASTPQSN